MLFFAYWVHLEGTYEERRDTARISAQARATQVAHVLDQEFESTFRAIDRFLLGLQQEGLHTSPNFENSVARMLSFFPLPGEARISLYRASGELRASTDPAQAPMRLTTAQSTVLRARHLPLNGPYLIVGAHDDATKNAEVRFARPLVQGGRVVGTMVADIPHTYFSSQLASITQSPGDSAKLVLVPDGQILASSQPGQFGAKVPADVPYLETSASHRGSVLFKNKNPSSPETDSVLAWDHLAVYPVIVTVSLSEASILHEVNTHIEENRSYAFTNLGLLSILIAAIVFLMVRLERKRKELAEQEALYHGLFDQNHSIKIISDPKTGRIIEANKAACDFYRYTREQFLKLQISDVNCLPVDEIRQHMAEALAAQRPSFLFPHRLADGEIRQVEVYAGPVNLTGRTVLYSIIHDVTSRFRLERQLKESEARYRTIFEAVPAGMVVVDGQGQFVAYNSAALDILTTHEEDLKRRAKPLFDPTGRELREKERPSWRALMQDLQDELLYTLDKHKQRVWATFNSRRIPTDADGHASGAIIGFSNVTELIRQKEKQVISQLVFDSTTEGIMVTDAKGVIRAVNKAFTKITGYSAREVIGKHPNVLSSGVHDAAFFRAMYESLATKGSWEGEITNRHKSGRTFVERLVINAAIHHSTGACTGYVGVLSDITERKEKEDQLWHKANFDPLTSLPNRTLLLDRAEQALTQSQRLNVPVAILFVDLDRFKPVNDTYGHAVGDMLLKAVAERLIASVRAEDTVGRLGGDEFVVLLPMVTDRASSLLVAHKVQEALCKPFPLGDLTVSIGACVGVALAAPHDDITAAALLDTADRAMYKAKENGRGRVEISSETSVSKAEIPT
ncbi:PAS domain S-box protein [Xanthobacter sp. TB0139]|uniref:PAS domain S-box protein n=1 Tax=Xanthobacter sp. TB0139 TaxID=3459178 RepID=UPI0040398B53